MGRRGSSDKQQRKKLQSQAMSEWVVLDISAFTKTTNKDKVLKILKAAKVEVCEITDSYASETRNKPIISMTIKRADYETKNPEYPGSWIIEEDYVKSDSVVAGPLL